MRSGQPIAIIASVNRASFRTVLLGSLLISCGGGNAPADSGAGSGLDSAADGGGDARVDGATSACVDTAPPSRPRGLALTLETDGVHLSWTASTDASGIASYRVYREGELLRETTETSLIDDSPRVPSTSYAYWVRAVDGAGNVSPRGAGASISTEAAEAGVDDAVDDDGDGWLETSYGFRLRATHPRGALTAEQLDDVVARMQGPSAREPYASWFSEIVSASSRDPLEAALAYRATGDGSYLAEVVSAIDATSTGLRGDGSFRLLMAVDIVFDDLPPASLQTLRAKVADDPDVFGYATLRFIQDAIDDPRARFMNNQHSSGGMRNGLLYAAVFALTDADAQPGITNAFPSLDLLRAVDHGMQPEGWFWRNESHIGGDLELHPERLPGSSPGGVYDNLGYDSAEESNTFWLWNTWANASGQPRFRGAYHDEGRGRFYYAMRLPHSESVSPSATAVGSFCTGLMAAKHVRIFTTTATTYPGPNLATRAAIAWRYQDPVMQSYAAEQICSGRWNDHSVMDLLYFDDSLAPVDPNTLPRSHYFAGPGIVTSRSAWTPGATLAVLLAGRGYGRRYEDGGSFFLHRRGPVVVHASKRARNGAHADVSFWFHVRGASSNALRVYDAQEHQCDDPTAPLLLASDALGGPLFERGGYASAPGEYSLSGSGCPEDSLDPHVTAYRGPEVRRYESAADYTYALADAAYPYRGKVERFERAMVHAGADSLLLFDRVEVTHADARRVWAAHFAPDPVVDGATPGFGVLDYADAGRVRFRGEDEVSVDLLLPVSHHVQVRGGTTVVSEGALAAGAVRGDAVTLPQPRWLLVRGDVAGQVRVQGADASGASLDEVVNISQRVDDELGGFAGNTVAEFASVTRVEGIDGFGALSVQVPHRYDTPDIDGGVHSFEPGRDGSEARPDARGFGRHTLEVDSLDEGSPATHFLVAISLADPGATPAVFQLAQGTGLVAAASEGKAYVFTLDRETDAGEIALPAEVTDAVLFGLRPNARYAVRWRETLTVAPDAGGDACSSSAGTLRLHR